MTNTDTADTITTNTEAICRALWGVGASKIDPDEAKFGVYPDPAGPEVAIGHHGEEIRGWPVRRMDGTEPVDLVPNFSPDGRRNGFSVVAEVWVQDRIGHTITGRDGRKLAQVVA